MNDINKLKQQQLAKHPGFNSYLECMTRTLFTGLASFCLGFSGLYFSQRLIQSKIFYPLQYNLLVSFLVASGLAYKVTSDRTKLCQEGWMAHEAANIKERLLENSKK